MSDSRIDFEASANRAVVSEQSLALIRRWLTQANCPSCTITSTSRTPAEQARVMLANIEQQGVDSQLALYLAPGDAVIHEYQRCRAAGLDRAATLAAMTAKIVAVGPGTVSHHCADPAKLNIIDIAPASLAHPAAFLAVLQAALAAGQLSRLLTPAQRDPAYHIEIPQR